MHLNFPYSLILLLALSRKSSPLNHHSILHDDFASGKYPIIFWFGIFFFLLLQVIKYSYNRSFKFLAFIFQNILLNEVKIEVQDKIKIKVKIKSAFLSFFIFSFIGQCSILDIHFFSDHKISLEKEYLNRNISMLFRWECFFFCYHRFKRIDQMDPSFTWYNYSI